MRVQFALPLLLVIAVLLPAQQNRPVRYRCPSGEEFTVTYRGDGNSPAAMRNARAVIEMAGKARLTLPQVEAASGTRFSDGYTVLWTKGGEVLLQSGTVNVSGCREGDVAVGNLAGSWTLIEISGNAVDLPRPPSIQFDLAAGRAVGFGGCNRFNSAIQADGSSLRLHGAASTKMACPGQAMALEDEFLRALETVRGYRQSGNRLELLDEGGGVRMTFRQ